MVRFWGEGQGGELSSLAGVCKPLLAPWDLPWGQQWQGELFLNKLGFPFTRFHRFWGEMGDFVINFVAKLEICHLQKRGLLCYGPLVAVDEDVPTPCVLQQPLISGQDDVPRRKESRY